MKTHRIALLFAFSTAASLVAQTAPPAPAATPPETIVLESFVVNTEKDSGYIAIDSLAGGRTATPIKLTPTAISSLTRTFLDDVAITDVREALKWTVNAIPSDLNAGKSSSPFNDWDFNFRGAGQSLQGGSGPTRNYFTFYQSADTYNIERLEFDRGPNSILFGVGTIGGVMSSYTKQARLDQDFITTQFTGDSNGGWRFEGDVNRRVSGRIAARINVLEKHHRGWRDQDQDFQRAADLALTFKLSDRTSVRVDGEMSKAERSFLRSTAAEGVTRYDGTVAQTWGSTLSTASGAVAAITGLPVFRVWIAGQPGLGLQNWAGGYRSNGYFLPMAPKAGWYPTVITNGTITFDGSRIPVMPKRSFTIAPKDALSRPEYNDVTVWLNHRFTEKFEVTLSRYYYQDSRDSQNYEGVGNWAIDVNRQMPNGQLNPNFGKKFGEFFLSKQTQDRGVDETRLQLTYRLETKLFGSPYRQTVSVSAGDQKITWTAHQYNAQITNSGITVADQNLVRTRIYEDNTHPYIGLPSSVGGMNIAYAAWPTHWFDFNEDYKLKHVAGFTHARLFDDKLSFLVGARHDRYDHYKIETIARTVGGPLTVVQDGASGTTYSAGAIYYLGPVGLYANWSKNFDPIGPGRNPSLSGVPFGPATGKGLETGLRFSSKDGKYYATASYYDSKSQDRITGTKIGFSGIWNNYFDARGEARNTVLGTLAYDDTEALHVRGYEFEVTANPTRSLRLQASYGRPDSEFIDALPGQRAYYAANFAAWDAAARLAINPTASTALRNALTNAQVTLDNNVAGRTRTGLVKYTSNVFANYTFSEGALKGLSFGTGAARTGRTYVATIRNTLYYRGEQTTTSLRVGYNTRALGFPTRLALNVENVLDDQDPIVSTFDGGYRDTSGVAIANGFILRAPRTIKFSARFTF
ncbi:MAG: TonB-dependent receptor plug domain-containing protein [Verrucomicrobia bacterium]|nr:TonB-dependent receptor plug domain-containing protein [Verrucomicrobiota bacterium]